MSFQTLKFYIVNTPTVVKLSLFIKYNNMSVERIYETILICFLTLYSVRVSRMNIELIRRYHDCCAGLVCWTFKFPH